jgi:hypothetical protein
MDEKTFKLTLSLTVGLTLLGTTMNALEDGIHNDGMKTAFEIMVLGSVVYVLIGGMVALGALKTLPSYGYGSDFAIENKNKNKGAALRALVLQEKMNNVRHLRNEASYQCLRNGMLLLLCAVAVHFFGDRAAGIVDAAAHRLSEWIASFWTAVVNCCGP